MAGTVSTRTIVAGVAAVVCVGVAVAVAVHVLRGPGQEFRQRPVSDETRQSLETLTRELVALGRSERKARLREVMSPDAPPRALDALAAQLEDLARAKDWRLAAADAYGPSLIKAIYDVSDRRGSTRQVALVFERRDGGLALLDVAR